jgi:2-iminobutanoate/2-iminopropanoate deaminase
MRKIEIKYPEKQSDTDAYSAGVLADGWLFIGGPGPIDLASGDTVEEETTNTLRHIKKIIEGDEVKCTSHVSDIDKLDRYNAVYTSLYRGIKPPRTTKQSVLWDNIKVGIDSIVKFK